MLTRLTVCIASPADRTRRIVIKARCVAGQVKRDKREKNNGKIYRASSKTILRIFASRFDFIARGNSPRRRRPRGNLPFETAVPKLSISVPILANAFWICVSAVCYARLGGNGFARVAYAYRRGLNLVRRESSSRFMSSAWQILDDDISSRPADMRRRVLGSKYIIFHLNSHS